MSKTSQRELSYFQLGQADAKRKYKWFRLGKKHRFIKQYQHGWNTVNLKKSTLVSRVKRFFGWMRK
jgi:hypothetical protein